MSDGDTPAKREELQLLRQARSWAVRITHSATRAIALRLQQRGDAMLFDRNVVSNDQLVAITAQGMARLLASGPRAAPCPFCGCWPVTSPSGALWSHPHGSRCILADFATSDVDGWNKRAGGGA